MINRANLYICSLLIALPSSFISSYFSVIYSQGKGLGSGVTDDFYFITNYPVWALFTVLILTGIAGLFFDYKKYHFTVSTFFVLFCLSLLATVLVTIFRIYIFYAYGFTVSSFINFIWLEYLMVLFA